ncbi:MAG: ABC transporter substrate-binding protein [Clostridiales Family XIII bacterium]|jgi:branched-chain amino acid transport system substrate-binding protein|nr:ABC transporter substrate-binding protein [Clostridiales Family XIII bacterium]
MKKKVFALMVTLILAASMLAACGDSGGSSAGGSEGGSQAQATGDAPASIKVGVLNPTTGMYAGMAEGTPYVDEFFRDYVNDELGGIYIEDYDAKLPIELVIYDTASNSDKTSELAAKLITEDQVDVLIARHTPDTGVPAATVAEQYGVPCIITDCPAGAFFGVGDHYWSFDAHADNPSYYEAYSGIWKAAGYEAGADNATIGWIFANDLDGTILAPEYKALAEADGYTVLDPGAYAAGTNDYSSLINQLKGAGIEVVFGVMSNPEFGTFWTQCQQLGYKPKIVVIGKAFMLESQAMAIGAELMDGIGNEIWWDVRFPYKSALMDMSGEEFGDQYYAATGKQAASPQGAKFASYEILIDALSRSANLEPETIRTAIAETDIDSIMGHINYGNYEVENFCKMPVVGGQWILQEDGSLAQEIVSNPHPENDIPVTAEVKTSGRAWE